MATLKLKPKTAAAKTGERRAPLRGKGVSRPRQTLEQAQTERAERQAAFEQRRAEEAQAPRREAAKPAGRPGSKPQQRPAPKSAALRREDSLHPDERRPRPEGAPQRARAGSGGQGRPDARQEPRRDQRRAAGPRPDAPFGQRPPERRPAPPRPAAARHHHDDDDDEGFRDPSLEGERLSKRMAAQGLASRREADEWIAAGWVRVDGKLAQLGQRVGPDAKIEIDPAARQEQAKQVTILLHKPIGYVSGQAEDGYEPASVLVRSNTHWSDDASGIKYHIGHARGLAPAGRLDIDSTGLLVLTQDGRVAKLLIGDDSKIEKEYLVRVEYQGSSPDGRLPAEDLARLNHGLELDGVQLKPAKVSWQNEDQLRFVLREGRKRQIRRMCELVGLKVVGLKRVRIGRINLGHLPPGQWRYLAPWERFD